ncbi:hypothetical protein [Streptacidiphilus monticola]|jgi:hypothetical protein|uniref:DUF3099 domain-containing protein n=1 Tax=Streptacidiphilus monticola TaxID=2161674 RepID=A0ABW1FX04_9ACTN
MRYAVVAVVLAAVCAIEWVTSPTVLAALTIVVPTVILAAVAVLAVRPLGDEDEAVGNRRLPAPARQ